MERLTAGVRDGELLPLLVGADLGRTAEAARRFAVMLGTLGPTKVGIARVRRAELSSKHVRRCAGGQL